MPILMLDPTQVCQNIKVAKFVQRDVNIPALKMNSDTLAFPEMNNREREILEAHADTCDWILEHESYQKWIENDSGILGIRGKPGSVKSTLVKKIFRTLNQTEEHTHIQLAFFYHRRDAGIQYSQIGMYRTLLHQLLTQVPSAGSTFGKLVLEKKKWYEANSWEWRLEELQEAFHDGLLAASKKQKIRVFIDALDEAGEEAAQAILKIFRHLKKNSSPKKLMLAYASHAVIILCLSSTKVLKSMLRSITQKIFPITLNLNLRNLWASRSDRKRERSFSKSLGSEIIFRASSVFIWVAIVVPLVSKAWNNGQSLPQIQKTLSNVPTDLDELYRHILNKVIDRSRISETLNLMQWVFLAGKPLSSIDIYFALASDDPSSIPELFFGRSKESIRISVQMQKRINSLSGGLAEVKSRLGRDDDPDDTVQFIHQSVKDFLVKDRFQCLLVDSSRDAIGLGHNRLARSCINFLKYHQSFLAQFATGMLVTVPFVAYSVGYCFEHASKAERLGILQTHPVVQLEYPSNDVIKSWQNLTHKLSVQNFDHQMLLSPGPTTTLQVALFWEINSVADELISLGVNVDESNEEGNVALHYAARRGCEAVVKKLIAANTSPSPRNISGASPLIMAIRGVHKSIIKSFLDLGKEH